MPLVPLCLAVQLVVMTAFGSRALADTPQREPAAIAVEIGRALGNRDFAAVGHHFSAALAKSLPAATIEAGWVGIAAELGGFMSVGAPSPADAHGCIVVPIMFEHGRLDLRIVVSKDGVTALVIGPHRDPAPAWMPPAYADATRFDAIDLKVGRVPFELPATLTVPRHAGRAPALVLVHGSGPGDRNESLGGNRPFQDLAEGLASAGIAVLRYDKRTRVYPESFVDAPDSTVREETIDDALAAVALLRGRDDIDSRRIFVLGHSLGGTLAPRIAADDPAIAGIVILAGATRPLPTILVEQLTYLARVNGVDERQASATIERAKAEAARALAARPGDKGAPSFGIPAAYWADLNGYDPVATARTLSIPILILQGLRDYQVTPDNLALFKTGLAGRRNVAIDTFPLLGHLFMSGSAVPGPNDYVKPAHVDAAVVERIARFLKGGPGE